MRTRPRQSPLLAALLLAAQSAGATEPAATPVEASRDDGFFSTTYRSPGLAAALSLNPLPIDFGNFYAENVGWGVAYTGAQVGLAGGMMWIGGAHACHGGRDCGDWSDLDRGLMIGLAGGYLAIKVVAALHAASAAGDFNASHQTASFWLSPAPGGLVLGFAR